MVFLLRRSGVRNADEHSPAVTFLWHMRRELNQQPSNPKFFHLHNASNSEPEIFQVI